MALYQDIYQVVFGEEAAHISQNGVSDFSSVKELLEDITYASAEKKALDIIQHAFHLAGYAVNPPRENCITIRDKAAELNFRLLIESTTESVDET